MSVTTAVRAVGVVGGAALGWAIGAALPWARGGVVGGAVGARLGGLHPPNPQMWPRRRRQLAIERVPLPTLLGAALGLVFGLVVAALFSLPLTRIAGWAGVAVPITLTVVLGFLGLAIGVQLDAALQKLLPEALGGATVRPSANGRILVDTSAIIDGRIADLTQTGFIQGTLVVPRFVLDELRHIADSSDSLRRNRGRRGLEVLGRLRRDARVPLEIADVDVRNGGEVDGKLVLLAKSMHAPILTTDFNLNRVAELQGVRVLNINELANALKPVVLPGEELHVSIIQEGKEPGQGISFLDDGTMVVVEGGKRYIGSEIDVSVTRVLQTAAGRIIFAQPRVAQG